MLTGSITVRRRGKQEGGRGGGHGKGSRREGGTKEAGLLSVAVR